MSKTHKKCKKGQKYPKKCRIFGFFLASFSRTSRTFCLSQWLIAPNKKCFFVAVTQCNKQNKSLLQWVSATNNIEKNSHFIVACDQGIGKKPQKQTSFKIWISPPLSNCFRVPFMKSWGIGICSRSWAGIY